MAITLLASGAVPTLARLISISFRVVNLSLRTPSNGQRDAAAQIVVAFRVFRNSARRSWLVRLEQLSPLSGPLRHKSTLVSSNRDRLFSKAAENPGVVVTFDLSVSYPHSPILSSPSNCQYWSPTFPVSRFRASVHIKTAAAWTPRAQACIPHPRCNRWLTECCTTVS